MCIRDRATTLRAPPGRCRAPGSVHSRVSLGDCLWSGGPELEGGRVWPGRMSLRRDLDLQHGHTMIVDPRPLASPRLSCEARRVLNPWPSWTYFPPERDPAHLDSAPHRRRPRCAVGYRDGGARNQGTT